mgnify:CR=1 FL=1
MGPERALNSLRKALAMGADRAVLVSDEGAAGLGLLTLGMVLVWGLEVDIPNVQDATLGVIQELKTYVRHENGRHGADTDQFDDLLMALAYDIGTIPSGGSVSMRYLEMASRADSREVPVGVIPFLANAAMAFSES